MSRRRLAESNLDGLHWRRHRPGEEGVSSQFSSRQHSPRASDSDSGEEIPVRKRSVKSYWSNDKTSMRGRKHLGQTARSMGSARSSTSASKSGRIVGTSQEVSRPPGQPPRSSSSRRLNYSVDMKHGPPPDQVGNKAPAGGAPALPWNPAADQADVSASLDQGRVAPGAGYGMKIRGSPPPWSPLHGAAMGMPVRRNSLTIAAWAAAHSSYTQALSLESSQMSLASPQPSREASKQDLSPESSQPIILPVHPPPPHYPPPLRRRGHDAHRHARQHSQGGSSSGTLGGPGGGGGGGGNVAGVSGGASRASSQYSQQYSQYSQQYSQGQRRGVPSLELEQYRSMPAHRSPRSPPMSHASGQSFQYVSAKQGQQKHLTQPGGGQSTQPQSTTGTTPMRSPASTPLLKSPRPLPPHRGDRGAYRRHSSTRASAPAGSCGSPGSSPGREPREGEKKKPTKRNKDGYQPLVLVLDPTLHESVGNSLKHYEWMTYIEEKCTDMRHELFDMRAHERRRMIAQIILTQQSKAKRKKSVPEVVLHEEDSWEDPEEVARRRREAAMFRDSSEEEEEEDLGEDWMEIAAREDVDGWENLGCLRYQDDPAVEAREKLTQDELLSEAHQEYVVSQATDPTLGEYQEDTIRQTFQIGTQQLDRRALAKSQVLNLQHCKLTEFHMASISHILTSHRHLTDLRLTGNALNDKSVLMLIEMMRRCRQITALNLSENPVGIYGAQAIADYLREFNNIVHLDLHSCPLGAAGAAALAAALEENMSVAHLNVSRCQLTDEAGAAFGDMLQTNISLLTFSLAWNGLGLKSAQAFTRGLSAFKCIVERLDLSWNCLGDYGGSCLGAAISVNDRLKSLDLSGNSLQDDSCLVLAHGIRKTQSITQLQLSHNPLGSLGGVRILRALMDNPHMSSCSLHQCAFVKMATKKKRRLYDENKPHGDYRLDLANALQRQVALELLMWRQVVAQQEPPIVKKSKAPEKRRPETAAERRKREAKEKEAPPKFVDIWEKVLFNGEPLAQKMLDEWAEKVQLPFTGVLELKVKFAARKPRLPTPMNTALFQHSLDQLQHQHAEDKWKVEFMRMLSEVSPISSLQASEMLRCIAWGSEKVEAVFNIFGCITDYHNLHLVISQLGPTERTNVVDRLAELTLYNAQNLTGHYRLDLSRHMDYQIAQQLIIQSRLEGLWRKDPLKVNLRNVTLNNVEVKLEDMFNLDKYELPSNGFLDLDYVELVPLHKPKKINRRHFERVLTALKEIVTGPHPPVRPHNWFPDYSKDDVFDADFVPKCRVSDLIPRIILAGGKELQGSVRRGSAQRGRRGRAKPGSGSDSSTGMSSGGEGGGRAGQGSTMDRLSANKAPQPRRRSIMGGPERSIGQSARRVSLLISNSKAGEKTKQDGPTGTMACRSMRVQQFVRAFATFYSVTADMLLAMLRVVGDGGIPSKEGILAKNTDKVNCCIALYARLSDLNEFSHIIRSLSEAEQVALCQRLGWVNILDVKRPDGIYYSLRLLIPEERWVANRLSRLAVKIQETRTCWENLQVNDRNFYVKEDVNMWQTILVASHCLTGSIGLITFTFVGTRSPVKGSHAILVQKNWRRKVVYKYYQEVQRVVRLVQTEWRKVLAARKLIEMERLKAEEEERKRLEEEADFW